MRIGEFTKSGQFVLTLLVAAVIGVPFALEQIGEATDMFRFPVTKTIKGWFGGGGRAVSTKPPPSIDWERYRQDLEEFTKWADEREVAVIKPSSFEVEEIQVKEERCQERRIWPVPIVSCTAANPISGRKGYIFVSGFDRAYEEGSMIGQSQELCGYEVVFVGERTVWLRAVFDSDSDTLMGIAKFPEFTRVEGNFLVKGSRKYTVRDAFPLKSGGWLMIDTFPSRDSAVFKILDKNKNPIASLLCVVIGAKGGF